MKCKVALYQLARLEEVEHCHYMVPLPELRKVQQEREIHGA